VHLVTDARRLPITARQKQECKHFEDVLDAIRSPRSIGRPR
jgi:hypothetical protein